MDYIHPSWWSIRFTKTKYTQAVNRMHSVLSQHLRIGDCIGGVLQRSHRLDCERARAGGASAAAKGGIPFDQSRAQPDDGHKKWKSRHSSSSIQVRPNVRPSTRTELIPPPDRLQLPLRLICCRRDATEHHNGGQP